MNPFNLSCFIGNHMTPSIFKAVNISNNLPFDYSINFRKFNTYATKKYWNDYLTNKTENSDWIDYSHFKIEKDSDNNRNYHSHYLTKLRLKHSLTEFTVMATSLFCELLKNHRILEGTNKKLLKVKTNPRNSSETHFQDTIYEIPYVKCVGSLGMIYIEPVVESSIIFYNNKCSDWGIVDGFVMGKK
jgi:hypothetical protein